MQQIVFIGFMTVIYIVILIGRFAKGRKKMCFWHEFAKFVLIEYIFGVLSVTLLPIYIRLGEQMKWSNNSINIIPFNFVREYQQLIQYDSFYWAIALKNVLGNVILFMPLGFLLPIVGETFRKVKNVLLVSCVISLLIELLQLLEMYTNLGFRMTDIDDFILNVSGGLLGFFCYISLLKWRNKKAF